MPVGVEEIIESASTAVIAADEDDCVIVYFEFFEEVENLPDLSVNHFDHCGIYFCGFRDAGPGLIFVIEPGGFVLGDSPLAVRGSPCTVAEKRPVLVVADKLYRFIEYQVL